MACARRRRLPPTLASRGFHGFLFFHRGSTHEYSTSKPRETVRAKFRGAGVSPAILWRANKVKYCVQRCRRDAGVTKNLRFAIGWVSSVPRTHTMVRNWPKWRRRGNRPPCERLFRGGYGDSFLRARFPQKFFQE